MLTLARVPVTAVARDVPRAHLAVSCHVTVSNRFLSGTIAGLVYRVERSYGSDSGVRIAVVVVTLIAIVAGLVAVIIALVALVTLIAVVAGLVALVTLIAVVVVILIAIVAGLVAVIIGLIALVTLIAVVVGLIALVVGLVALVTSLVPRLLGTVSLHHTVHDTLAESMASVVSSSSSTRAIMSPSTAARAIMSPSTARSIMSPSAVLRPVVIMLHFQHQMRAFVRDVKTTQQVILTGEFHKTYARGDETSETYSSLQVTQDGLIHVRVD